MIKVLKVISLIILIILIVLFIHPQKEYYEGKVIGKIIDENGIPISNAIVTRIEEKSSKNKEHGYFEYTKFKSQTVISDLNGNFQLDEKSRIYWFHSPFDLLAIRCDANFEIEKVGYETYQTKNGEFKQVKKYISEKVIFKPIIVLKKNEIN